MSAMVDLLPERATILKAVISTDEHDCKPLLIKILDSIRSGDATWQSFGIIEGSEAEAMRLYRKMNLITQVAISLSNYNKLYSIEEQLEDCVFYKDDVALSAGLRLGRFGRFALQFVMMTIREDSDLRSSYDASAWRFPFDVLVAIGVRSAEWHEDTIFCLADQPKERGIITEDVKAYINETLKDLYFQAEVDSIMLDTKTAIDKVRRLVGVPPVVDNRIIVEEY